MTTIGELVPASTRRQLREQYGILITSSGKTKPARVRYNVQCLNGHVYQAPFDSELEQRCIEHERRGFIDALILHPSDCEVCQEQEKQRRSRDWMYYF